MLLVLNKRTMSSEDSRNAVYVGRPTKWGNPFSVEQYGRDGCLDRYRSWIMSPEQSALRSEMKSHLAGKNLICWCYPRRCHAAIIMSIANGS